MSQWTHVAGLVRVDSLDGLGVHRDTSETLRSIIEASGVPVGSEGPVRTSLQRTREDSSLSWGHISIWGDLRDYGDASDVEELCHWFRQLCQHLLQAHYVIRQAVLAVEVEGQPPFVLHADLVDDAQGHMTAQVVSVPVPQLEPE